jgi:RIO kinase 1
MSDFEHFDDLDDLDMLESVRNVPDREHRRGGNPAGGRSKHHAPVARPLPPVDLELALLASEQDEFHFSYDASRHERVWIIDSLGGFFDQHSLDDDQHWLDDILRLVKGGKEAHVYQCLASPTVTGLDQPYIAAKVYRPRQFRNLKNDHAYREGRQDLDSEGRLITNHGMQHAMHKKTAYGLELLHTSWIEHEAQTMRLLYEAGADVPALLVSANNALLMSYIGGDETPAPTLNGVSLRSRQAQRLFERVLHNIDLMLAQKRVHADLSAYNILYWEDEITLIDFPQAIDPLVNRNAFTIFERDVRRVCEYFQRQGVRSNPSRLAADLWRKHGYRLSPEIHPALLDAEDERDRNLWQAQEL